MLKALIALIDSRRWISELDWEKIIKHADKDTLLYLKDEGLWHIKYFTRSDWLGPAVRDRLLPLVNSRLQELNGNDIITILKGLL